MKRLIPHGIQLKEDALTIPPYKNLGSVKEYGFIRDKKVFSQNIFEVGDVVKIRIYNLETDKQISYWKKFKTFIFENGIRWASTIHRVDNTGFYTKEIGSDYNPFTYNHRTEVMDDLYLNKDVEHLNNPFEIGDDVVIEIKKVIRNE